MPIVLFRSDARRIVLADTSDTVATWAAKPNKASLALHVGVVRLQTQMIGVAAPCMTAHVRHLLPFEGCLELFNGIKTSSR